MVAALLQCWSSVTTSLHLRSASCFAGREKTTQIMMKQTLLSPRHPSETIDIKLIV